MNSFDKIYDEMFFNIQTFKPDSTVFDFMQKYFPLYCSLPPKSTGNWSVYPEGIEKLHFIDTEHSVYLKKHPFFKCKFRKCKLEIGASEIEERNERSIKYMKLWFMFDSKADATEAFNKLKEMFNKVCGIKKIIQKNGKLIADYFDKESPIKTAGFILTKDEIDDGKYKILFQMK